MQRILPRRHATRRVHGLPLGALAALALAALGLGLPLAPRPAAAQAKPSAATDTSPAIPLTFAVPEAPAFTFLGVSPAKVTRASSARDIGAAVINGVDSTGKALTGVAIGATLWTLLPDVKVGLTAYQTSWRAYALANTLLSLGSARSAGDSSDTDIAVGIRTTLFDRSDPMRDTAFVHSLTRALRGCIEHATTAVSLNNVPVTGKVSIDAPAGDTTLACAGSANDTLRVRWFHNNWNQPALSWGFASGWRARDSEVSSLGPIGVSTWLAGAFPAGRSAQLLGQLQFDHRNRRDTLAATDVLTYGARIARGTKDHNLFAEVAGTRRFRDVPGVSRSNVQWSGGMEIQLADAYWLSTGFGKRYAAQGKPDRVVLLANVRWGIAGKSRLGLLTGAKP